MRKYLIAIPGMLLLVGLAGAHLAQAGSAPPARPALTHAVGADTGANVQSGAQTGSTAPVADTLEASSAGAESKTVEADTGVDTGANVQSGAQLNVQNGPDTGGTDAADTGTAEAGN